MPAEWEHQEAVLLSFPRRDGDWGELLDSVARQHLELIITIAEVTPVRLLVADEILLLDTLRKCPEFGLNFIEAKELTGSKQIAPALLAGIILNKPVHLFFLPMDDVWARDFAPITVLRNNQPVLLDFTFNGWGNKFDAQLDNTSSRRLHTAGFFGHPPLETIDLVLEGGSIESDGAGTIMTSSQCLLSKERNPDLTQDEITQRLKILLGAERILYLDHGHLIGDDTDAHIDTLARFTSEDTIVYQACDDVDDEHYESFQLMEEQLKSFRRRNGEPYRLLALPWHPPTYSSEDNRRLPGSYANFLITNGAVIIPGAGKQTDELAVAVIQQALPDHRMLLVDAWYFVEQHGSVHCLTMQLLA